MNTILLRPADPQRDFEKVAAWFTILEDEPNTETGLKEYFEKNRARIFHKVAEDERAGLVGFYWALREKLAPQRVFISLYVKPERRGQGVGRQLYEDLARTLAGTDVKTLRISVGENCLEGLAFGKTSGFHEKSHAILMALNLDTFDDRPYGELIARLKSEGFQFTTMEELGNTPAAQLKLYLLNDGMAATTPGSEGEHPWASFEDFQQSVCQAEWYQPAGQFVVIDTANGDWAAMSAITRFAGADYAYNLFTGVEIPYRGRKLAQAVKVLALRYARAVLQVQRVRTQHNALNLPMIAIDCKFGYDQIPGTFTLEKDLE